jgi:aspartate carbamoyltransferase catalytic subunit
MNDLISISDLSKEEIKEILDAAKEIKERGSPLCLQGKLLACCFFEPSTRTRLSFEAAMHRLGGSVIGFSDGRETSTQKGESLHDTIKIIGSFADLIVIRHPAEGSARVAADATSVPIINAGDGANQHPTQTLLDLFTIRERCGRIEGLTIGIAGDLAHARTVHSLAIGLCHYGVRLYFFSPPELELAEEIAIHLRKAGVKFSYHHTLKEALSKLDVLYLTRTQKERHLRELSSPLAITKKMLTQVKDSLQILHPLPRLHELDPAIDETPHAAYFQQAENGLFVRQALLTRMLT